MSDNATNRPKPICACADKQKAQELTDAFEEKFQQYSEHPETRPGMPANESEFAAATILIVRGMGNPCGPVYDSEGHFVGFYGIRIKPEAMSGFLNGKRN